MEKVNIIYSVLSKVYDLLDIVYFANKSRSPREAIINCISDDNVKIIDLCCGTMSNSINISLKRPNAEIIGLDISKPMLDIAKRKIKKTAVTNASAVFGNATDTEFDSNTFDYAVLGLVLHETNDELSGKIISEIKRILKPTGKLLVIEWERSERLWQRFMFFPIKVLEPKPFKKFYRANKQEYFKKHGFVTTAEYHCDYTSVLELSQNP